MGRLLALKLCNIFNMKSSLQITSDCYQNANYRAANTRSTLLSQPASLSHQYNSKYLQIILANTSKMNVKLLNSFLANIQNKTKTTKTPTTLT